MSINHMSKLASGAAHGASAGIVVALLTFSINFYFKRKVSLAQIKALEARGYIPSDQLGEE